MVAGNVSGRTVLRSPSLSWLGSRSPCWSHCGWWGLSGVVTNRLVLCGLCSPSLLLGHLSNDWRSHHGWRKFCPWRSSQSGASLSNSAPVLGCSWTLSFGGDWSLVQILSRVLSFCVLEEVLPHLAKGSASWWSWRRSLVGHPRAIQSGWWLPVVFRRGSIRQLARYSRPCRWPCALGVQCASVSREALLVSLLSPTMFTWPGGAHHDRLHMSRRGSWWWPPSFRVSVNGGPVVGCSIGTWLGAEDLCSAGWLGTLPLAADGRDGALETSLQRAGRVETASEALPGVVNGSWLGDVCFLGRDLRGQSRAEMLYSEEASPLLPSRWGIRLKLSTVRASGWLEDTSSCWSREESPAESVWRRSSFSA